jgi:endonuclease/exonuclease/phosphatase family metal-dependent hydrolase
MGLKMKIVSWNCRFWENWKNKKNRTEWRNNILEYLNKLNYDFLLLQEINAILLYRNEEETLSNQDLYKVDEFFYSETGYHAFFGSSNFDNKNDFIYYHELKLDEIGTETTKDITPWGNSIIARKKFNLNNNCIEKHGHRLNSGIAYCGRNILMCHDYSMEDGKTISLINFYGKHDPNNGYPILEYGINDICDFMKTNTDNHITILAGDFNSDPVKEPVYKRIFFDELEKMGFVNCTQENDFENTMVQGVKAWPNDKVFVNRPYNKLVKCKLLKDTDLKLSDHRPIECIINI